MEEQKPYGYVYLVRNNVNGKVYVGQTVHPIAYRWYGHVRKALTNKSNTALARAIVKYGEGAFSVLEIGRASSREDLDAMEVKLIAEYRAMERGIGYNLREGGSGGRMAAETREKLRLAQLGKPAHNKGKKMPEHQRLWRIEHLKDNHHGRGKPHPVGTGQKISDSRKGKPGAPHTAEWKAAQSTRLSQRYRQMTHEQRCLERNREWKIGEYRELVGRAEEMRSKGMPWGEIANVLNRSKALLHKACKALKGLQ